MTLMGILIGNVDGIEHDDYRDTMVERRGEEKRRERRRERRRASVMTIGMGGQTMREG